MLACRLIFRPKQIDSEYLHSNGLRTFSIPNVQLPFLQKDYQNTCSRTVDENHFSQHTGEISKAYNCGAIRFREKSGNFKRRYHKFRLPLSPENEIWSAE